MVSREQSPRNFQTRRIQVAPCDRFVATASHSSWAEMGRQHHNLPRWLQSACGQQRSVATDCFAAVHLNRLGPKCCRRGRSEPLRRPSTAPLDQPWRPTGMRVRGRPMRLTGSPAQVPNVAHFRIGTNSLAFTHEFFRRSRHPSDRLCRSEIHPTSCPFQPIYPV